ncbi:MAG: hypothetical protein ABH803_03685 [Candidatus Micrarchaeota archaeon]
MTSDFKKKLREELKKCDDYLKNNYRQTLQQRVKALVKSINPSELKRESNGVLEDTRWKIKMLKRREIIQKKINEIS